ncbi:unnamed protein product [Prunus armeniaca]
MALPCGLVKQSPGWIVSPAGFVPDSEEIRGGSCHRMLDEEVLRSIMMTCIILHNMIVEDEYDYDAEEVFEPDPMNTSLTRIYERPIGPNGLPLEPEPILRDG